MKKYIAGFLAGALFTVAGAAFADDIQSLIGKKIQGQTVIKVDGQVLDTAIIVEGKSYSPTRSIAEAAGYDVSMKDKEIVMNKKPVVSGRDAIAKDPVKLNELITSYKESIVKEEARLESYKKIIEQRPDEAAAYQDSIDYANSKIKMYQEWIAEKEEQLAALK
ncbi:hypothetical protein [Paenibacillus sp. FSL R5-0519]|uniref:hypothetical protein n=1 Tax=Paenibacillus sp. FSL R5-0519 TaxID=2921648 RepID=UPI0030D99336